MRQHWTDLESSVVARYFPRSAAWWSWTTAPAERVRESARGAPRRLPFSERHLHCIWYDALLRPTGLRTVEGEEVSVEDPGTWNMGAGPDFLGAALLLGPGRRRVAGDVEIHIRPSDWIHHRHRADPRYARVVAHVTYFPGSIEAGQLPQGAVQIALKDALASESTFSFDDVDLAAYPFAARGTPPPCQRVLADFPAESREALLAAAGEERLRRKAERLAALFAEQDPDQVLYSEIMGALGYRHNKGAFRLLAERLPLARLRADAANDSRAAAALLLGVAGLLPDRLRAEWDDETRRYVRQLWDVWWTQKERWGHAILPRASWRLAGIRPANHPVRRLAAAASLFTRTGSLAWMWKEQAEADATGCLKRIADSLATPAAGYWSRRWSFGGKPLGRPAALLGEDRVAAILVNLFVPFLAAIEAQVDLSRLWNRLPLGAENTHIRHTANNLFGQDHGPSLYRNALARQGLLQIFSDFCLNDRSRCAECVLPTHLAALQQNGGATEQAPRSDRSRP